MFEGIEGWDDLDKEGINGSFKDAFYMVSSTQWDQIVKKLHETFAKLLLVLLISNHIQNS